VPGTFAKSNSRSRLHLDDLFTPVRGKRHSLRHAFVSTLFARRVPSADAATWLGGGWTRRHRIDQGGLSEHPKRPRRTPARLAGRGPFFTCAYAA
jgi:hypothetical protein